MLGGQDAIGVVDDAVRAAVVQRVELRRVAVLVVLLEAGPKPLAEGAVGGDLIVVGQFREDVCPLRLQVRIPVQTFRRRNGVGQKLAPQMTSIVALMHVGGCFSSAGEFSGEYDGTKASFPCWSVTVRKPS